MVPGAGIEPALPKKPDFESGASTSSATPAWCDGHIRGVQPARRAHSIFVDSPFRKGSIYFATLSAQ